MNDTSQRPVTAAPRPAGWARSGNRDGDWVDNRDGDWVDSGAGGRVGGGVGGRVGGGVGGRVGGGVGGWVGGAVGRAWAVVGGAWAVLVGRVSTAVVAWAIGRDGPGSMRGPVTGGGRS